MTVAPKAAARSATAVPIAPSPTIPIVRPRSVRNLARPSFAHSRPLWRRIARWIWRKSTMVTPMTCSAIASPWMPRALVSATGAVAKLRKQEAGDARRRALDPPQARGRRELVGLHLRQERDVGVREFAEAVVAGGGVDDRQVRERLPEPVDLAGRQRPDRVGIDRRDDLHRPRRHSPDRPPRFSISRISPITIVLSAALTMS